MQLFKHKYLQNSLVPSSYPTDELVIAICLTVTVVQMLRPVQSTYYQLSANVVVQSGAIVKLKPSATQQY